HLFFFQCYDSHRDLHSFPTRRSSDLIENCFEKTTTPIEEVTHLILVSCTGMYAPGLEMDIIHHFGIRQTAERYAIHFMGCYASRSEEHTSELQSRENLVCRLLLEKKK